MDGIRGVRREWMRYVGCAEDRWGPWGVQRMGGMRGVCRGWVVNVGGSVPEHGSVC